MSQKYTIPKVQRAAIVAAANAPLLIKHDHPVRQPKDLLPGECLVRLDCTGVCHSDLHARNDDWPIHPIRPLVGGHEGVGIVVAIGAYTQDSPVKLGDRVGIKWIAYSCLRCEQCKKGRESVCPNQKCSGFTVDGTFQEYVVSYTNHVTPIPANMDSAEAASILCAGLTVYRAIKNCNATIGDWIVLPGAGGGLGHLAVQYAVAMGLRVVAIDTGDDKRDLCLKLGAERWIDFKKTKDIVADIKAATDGLGPHATIITAANSLAYEQAVDYLRNGGTMMVVGLPGHGKLSADIFFTVTKSISIMGSCVGNRQDAVEALNIASRGQVRCYYILKELDDLSEIYEGLEQGHIVGRVVVNMK